MRTKIAALAVLLVAPMICAMPASAQKQGGTLRIYHRDNPPSASIHEEATISTVMPFMSIYNNLVVFDPQSKQNAPDHIVPDLATEWAWSEDGTRLTFKLRDGVTWHDGKPFTSADVKCTWDMLISPESKLRKNPRKSWWFNLKEVTVNGDREVTFVLGRPQPSVLTMLAGAPIAFGLSWLLFRFVLHPLLGRFEPSLLADLAAAVEAGTSAQDTARALDARVVSEAEVSNFSPPGRVLFNVNDESDLAEAERLAAE